MGAPSPFGKGIHYFGGVAGGVAGGAGVVPREPAAGVVVAGVVPPLGGVVVVPVAAPPRPVAGVVVAGLVAPRPPVAGVVVPAAAVLAFMRVLISLVMSHSLLEYTIGLFGADRS